MMTGAEIRRKVQEIQKNASKPYGMQVCTYISNTGSRTDSWDIQDGKELESRCDVFYKVAKGEDHPIVKVVISARANRPDQQSIILPSKGAEHILQAMEKNTYLVEVKTPESFFDKKQNERLHVLLNKNIEAAKERQKQAVLSAQKKAAQVEKNNKKQRIIWSILGAVSALGLTLVAGLAVLPMLGLSLFGAAVGFVGSTVRQAYLEKASRYYNMPNKVPTSKFGEGESFKAGVEAQFWPGYFKSYFLSATYLHPVAFAGGMKHALDSNTSITKKVKASC